MRNASHRSICRLRRAARRVGGGEIRRGWRAKALARGAPSPALLLSCALGRKPLSLEPPLGHSLPQSWVQPHPSTEPLSVPSWGVQLAFEALASLYPSVHLPLSVSLCVSAFLYIHIFLGGSSSFCLCVPLFLHEYLPISICVWTSLSTCLLSACFLGFLFLTSPFFRRLSANPRHTVLLSTWLLSVSPAICTQVVSSARLFSVRH